MEVENFKNNNFISNPGKSPEAMDKEVGISSDFFVRISLV